MDRYTTHHEVPANCARINHALNEAGIPAISVRSTLPWAGVPLERYCGIFPSNLKSVVDNVLSQLPGAKAFVGSTAKEDPCTNSFLFIALNGKNVAVASW